MTQPIDFLQAVAGFAQAADRGRDCRLATVDPAYVSTSYPGTLPRVTFDGEATMSAKRYPVLSPYWPRAGDRVLMVPVGTTYLIGGASAWTPQSLPVQADNFTGFTGITSATPAAGSPVLGTSFVAPPNAKVWISVSSNLYISTGAAGAELALGWELRNGSTVGSGTVVLAPDVVRSVTAGRTTTSQAGGTLRYLVDSGLTAGNSYNVRTMHWISGGTGIVTYRRIAVEAA